MQPADFATVLSNLIDASKLSLDHFMPEAVICGTITLILLASICLKKTTRAVFAIALVGVLVALCCLGSQLDAVGKGVASADFGGVLAWDGFTVPVRGMILLFAILALSLSGSTMKFGNRDATDFYTLLLGSTLGLMVLAQSNNLLMAFIGFEMASIPGYALVAFQRNRLKASEASLKYIVYGAGASGVMLYGISLLSGLAGTFSIPEIGTHVAAIVNNPASSAATNALLLSLLLIFVGFAFKLSLVPFHFWCPDAFEGASSEVAGFLSVGGKVATFSLLVRLSLALSGAMGGESAKLVLPLGIGLGVVAMVSVTFGNLAAYFQRNVKRVFAYSTIAHSGYMLMAVSALLVLRSSEAAAALTDVKELTQRCIEGLVFYLFVYVFMNLGAFGLTALMRNHFGSEDLDGIKGFGRVFPIHGACMAVCVFSLVGLPPLGGFWGKFVVFYALFMASKVSTFMMVVLLVGGLNTVFSLFYYVGILKAIFLGEPNEKSQSLVPASSETGLAMLIALPILLLGMFPGAATDFASEMARSLVR